MELQQKISKVNLERHIGNQLEVMVEGITKEGKYYITRSYMDKIGRASCRERV